MAAAAAANWVPTGDGLRLETARAVAKAHGVPLDVVLKGFYVDAVDGPAGFPDLHGVEDHVTVTNLADGRHLIKFANYKAFEDACEAPTAPGQQQQEQDGARLTVVIMPYADLDSCEKLEDLVAYPEFGYTKIYIANYDMLLWKKRDMADLNEEADKCRQLSTEMETVMSRLFPANKWRRLGMGSGDRKIAKERLLKSHLDAKRYGDAHDLLLSLLSHRDKLRRELANARREVQDIVETATQEIGRIADQLEAMGVEPRLLGCGI